MAEQTTPPAERRRPLAGWLVWLLRATYAAVTIIGGTGAAIEAGLLVDAKLGVWGLTVTFVTAGTAAIVLPRWEKPVVGWVCAKVERMGR